MDIDPTIFDDPQFWFNRWRYGLALGDPELNHYGNIGRACPVIVDGKEIKLVCCMFMGMSLDLTWTMQGYFDFDCSYRQFGVREIGSLHKTYKDDEFHSARLKLYNTMPEIEHVMTLICLAHPTDHSPL